MKVVGLVGWRAPSSLMRSLRSAQADVSCGSISVAGQPNHRAVQRFSCSSESRHYSYSCVGRHNGASSSPCRKGKGKRQPWPIGPAIEARSLTRQPNICQGMESCSCSHSSRRPAAIKPLTMSPSEWALSPRSHSADHIRPAAPRVHSRPDQGARRHFHSNAPGSPLSSPCPTCRPSPASVGKPPPWPVFLVSINRCC